MSVNISFHNVDNSSVLDEFILKKSNKLNKFVNNKLNIDWIIEKDNHDFIPKAIIKLDHKVLSLSAKAPDAFEAVNIVFEKAKRVVSDEHSKRSMH